MEIKRNALKRVNEKRTGLNLQALPNDPVHEVGKTYFDGYWFKSYKVLELRELPNSWMGWAVTCRWQDGDITTHCTKLNQYEDFLVCR